MNLVQKLMLSNARKILPLLLDMKVLKLQTTTNQRMVKRLRFVCSWRKLQTEVEAKSHTIAAVLIAAFDSQHIIRGLKYRLQQVKEAQRRRLLDSKSNSLNNASDENAKGDSIK
ncbi:10979_t:CDS:1 [Paraglomus occultum]|uniref:10979_t:CDS:1 n=1 Tax=Paraglomus occultum TaxID=144539 RepID=A0A9N9FSN9_9GLOM|nr:10979_t:CDS:1 [Paraglomus occultum]